MNYWNPNPMYVQNSQSNMSQQALQIALARVPGQVLHVDMDNEIL